MMAFDWTLNWAGWFALYLITGYLVAEILYRRIDEEDAEDIVRRYEAGYFLRWGVLLGVMAAIVLWPFTLAVYVQGSVRDQLQGEQAT